MGRFYPRTPPSARPPKKLLLITTYHPTSQAAESFQQKAELASILSHPNIVPIYKIGDTWAFYSSPIFHHATAKRQIAVRSFRDGPKDLLPSKRILLLQEAITIISDVLDALDYAHSQDIVHWDIKPAGILVETRTNCPVITGFGLARFSRGPKVIPRLTAGTPIYIAPEQIGDGVVVGRRLCMTLNSTRHGM